MPRITFSPTPRWPRTLRATLRRTQGQKNTNHARYRAAEVTVKNGYRYFSVIPKYTSESTGPAFLPSGNRVTNPWYIIAFRCHNDFEPDAFDAEQLMSILGAANRS